MSEFPSLGNRAGGGGDGLGMMPQGRTNFSAAAQQQRDEFAIQSEDFPALGGGGGGGCVGKPDHSGGNSILGSGLGMGGDHSHGMGGIVGGGGGDIDGDGSKSASVSQTGFSSMLGEKDDDGTTDGHRFGLRGLLTVIRMTDQDLNTLALGTDLTTLGLNLNSPE